MTSRCSPWVLLLAGSVLLVATALSLLTGPGMWAGATSWHLEIDPTLLMESRLPRTLTLLLTGGSLSVAGLIMQLMTQNHYVEPATTGTTQGAALGILLMAILFPNVPVLWKIMVASGCALVCSLVFLLLLRHIQIKSTLLVPVIGMMYSAMLTALMTFLALHYDLLQSVISWQSGDFSAVLAGRYEVIWLAAVVIALLWWVADSFTIIALGQDYATTIGLHYRRLVLLGMLAIAVICGLTVALVGTLPFLGLVVPNLVRILVGDNTRRALPWTFLIGSSLVISCDIVGRLLIYPFEIPVGSILSVVGALLFLLLLFRQPGRRSRS